MAFATVEFPRSLLRERTGRLELGRRTVSPGMGGTGVLPLIATDGGGLWELDYGPVDLRTRDQIRMWEVLAALSDGGATPFVVPWCNCMDAPFPVDADGKPITGGKGVPFSDPVPFSDGTLFEQGAISAVSFGTLFLLRSTQIVIRIDVGSPLRGGEHFSIYHPSAAGWRIYRVVGIVTAASPYYTVTIRPPLREDVPNGTPIEFNNPRGTFQLANPRAMDLTREMRKFGSPSASFVESFP